MEFPSRLIAAANTSLWLQLKLGKIWLLRAYIAYKAQSFVAKLGMTLVYGCIISLGIFFTLFLHILCQYRGCRYF